MAGDMLDDRRQLGGALSGGGQSEHHHDLNWLRRFDPVFGEQVSPELDRYLYHYTCIETLPKIQDGMAFRFGLLRDMNDPQESQAVIPQLHLNTTPPQSGALTDEENEEFESRDWNLEINTERRRSKIGSFVMDNEPDLSRFDDDDPVRMTLELLARFAARGFAHPRMWAQYAAGHTGVCIVFDWEGLHGAVDRAAGGRFMSGFGPVTYARLEYGPRLGSFDIRRLLEGRIQEELVHNYKSALLEKHPDWSHESEFRFLAIDGTDDPFFVPVDASCVAGLVIGPLCDGSKHQANVQAFANTFDIASSVRRAWWPQGRLELLPLRL